MEQFLDDLRESPAVLWRVPESRREKLMSDIRDIILEDEKYQKIVEDEDLRNKVLSLIADHYAAKLNEQAVQDSNGQIQETRSTPARREDIKFVSRLSELAAI